MKRHAGYLCERPALTDGHDDGSMSPFRNRRIAQFPLHIHTSAISEK